MGQRRIEYLPVDDVLSALKNPKSHDEGAILESIDRFGVIDIPVLDERTDRLVAGHGRLKSVRDARDAGTEPPDGVEVGEDGVWRMPMVLGWASKDDDEAHAAGVALNRLTELGGWYTPDLVELLDGFGDDDLAVTGFTPEDLSAMAAGLEKVEPEERPIVSRNQIHFMLTVPFEMGDNTREALAAIAATSTEAVLSEAAN